MGDPTKYQRAFLIQLENRLVGMNTKVIFSLKVAAVVFIGMCVVILLSVNKIASSILLTLTAIIIMLPIGKSKLLKWGRLVFILVMFALVLWNISTTEYQVVGYKDCYDSGVKFFDQVHYIFDGFLKNVFGIRPCRGEL
ncbi:MAG: hypothetical protein ACOYY3_01310 [Chloroflexota bacterium]